MTHTYTESPTTTAFVRMSYFSDELIRIMSKAWDADKERDRLKMQKMGEEIARLNGILKGQEKKP